MIKTYRFIGCAIDPVHIGAGGYRLGRVDNTIVREPATDLPKIPGTSLAGVIREYATIHFTEQKSGNRTVAEETAAGIFGDKQRQGLIRFYDAGILLFPVPSLSGTIWLSTKELLTDWFGFGYPGPDEIADDEVGGVMGLKCDGDYLNLGWLALKYRDIGEANLNIPQKIKTLVKRIAIVSDRMFGNLVNDHLEVRTSVRINPQTGAAETGGLFTYEAIPRGTVLGFEIAIMQTNRAGNEQGESNLEETIEAAMSYLRLLGVGGMGTRGFGRIDFFKQNQTSEKGSDE